MFQYWQQFIVLLIVTFAALHACAKYLPASWRRRVVYFLGRRGHLASKVALWLAPASGADSGCGSGCSGCKSAQPCSDDKATATATAEPAARRVIKLHITPHH